MDTWIYYGQKDALEQVEGCRCSSEQQENELKESIIKNIPVELSKQQENDPRLVVKLVDHYESDAVQCFVMGKGKWSVKNTIFETRNLYKY